MLALTIAVIVRKQSCVSTEKTNQNAAKAYAFTRRDRARASEREREREREREVGGVGGMGNGISLLRWKG
jgi:hypothetical protein